MDGAALDPFGGLCSLRCATASIKKEGSRIRRILRIGTDLNADVQIGVHP